MDVTGHFIFHETEFPPLPLTRLSLPPSQFAPRAGTLMSITRAAFSTTSIYRYTSFWHTFSFHVISQMSIPPTLEKLTQMTVEDKNNFASRAFAGNNFANSATI